MKYRVKKRWILVGVGLISLVGGVILERCFNKDDHLGYLEVLERANPALSLDKDQTYRASQQRVGVQKEFWHIKGDQRLEATLQCAEAELVYEKEGEKQVIVENMKDVRCLIQEEIFYVSPEGKKTFRAPRGVDGYVPQQTVRFVVAETAKYHYTTETLDAKQVDMLRYTLPGHKLPKDIEGNEPNMKGKADMAIITIIDKAFKFNAEKFKGTIF